MADLFGIKIKTYDFVKPDTVAIVKAGIEQEVINEKTSRKSIFVLKQPEMVKIVNVATPNTDNRKDGSNE